MELSEKLRSGKNVYGTLITSNSPRFVETTAALGLDYVFIDTEHVAIDRLTLAWMCMAYRYAGLSPIVRIPSHSPYQATQVLDGGAKGVVAPYVETAQQVKELRGAVKLRPLKGQKLIQALGCDQFEKNELNDYITDHNKKYALIINIESAPAMDNLDEILSVPGVDAILIGPHDLSCSLGIPERYDHPEFEKAVIHIIKTARSKGIGAGIHVTYGDLAQEIRFAQAGANLILHGADIINYSQSMRADINNIKEAMNDLHDNDKDEFINI